MGPIAFVILRKREGLLQCVYEPGAADFSLKDLKEADTIEVSGDPGAFRKSAVRNRGQDEVGQDSFGTHRGNAHPGFQMENERFSGNKPDLRPISLRNIRERAKFRIQEGIVRASVIS